MCDCNPLGGSSPTPGAVRSAFAAFADLTAPEFPTTGLSDKFVALTPVPAAQFLLTGDGFTLGDDCVLTYTGVGCVALVSLLMTLWSPTNSAVLTDLIALAVSLNGDLIGLDWFAPAAVQAGSQFAKIVVQAAVEPDAIYSTTRRVTLAPGDTLQPIAAARQNGGSNFNVGAGGLAFTVLQLE